MNSDLGEIEAMCAKLVEAEGDEPGGVQGGELIGVADEGGAGEEVFDGVFVFGQDAMQDKGVDASHIVEVPNVHRRKHRALRAWG